MPDTMARRLVRELYAYTGGRPLQWAPLNTIARRLVLDDQTANVIAQNAADKDWLLFEGGHSICLTEAGRRIAGTR